MAQLSDLIRATRGQAAETSLHREAVAHVEAEHTDALLVRSSGDADTVAVPRSKSSKPRHIVLTEEGAEFFSQHSAEALAAS